MAVTFDENVIRITADAAEQSIASGDIAAGGFSPLRVRKIRWIVASGAVAGDNAQILDDTTGDVLWESVATQADQFVDESDYETGFDFWPDDLTGLRAVVDRGTLYIYLGGHANLH